MYIPRPFQENNQQIIFDFISQNSFATLVTFDGEKPIATHLLLEPVYNAGGKLFLEGHMARANPQWRTFDGEKEILAIFSGAHTYISPRWYDAPERHVPTWSYQAVHVYGRPQVIENTDELYALLKRLVEKFEQNTSYKLETVAPEITNNLIKGITGFRIEATRVEAAFKLNQTQDNETYENIIAELEKRDDENSHLIATAMRELRQNG